MNAPHTRSEFIFVHMTELQLGRQEARRVDRNSLSLSFGALRVQAQRPAGSTTTLAVLSLE